MMLLTMTSCVKNSFEDKWKDIIVNCDTSQEMTSVFNAYPSFKDWAYNYGMNIGKPNKDYIYKYCYDKTIDGKYKIWDYEDLKN